MKMIKNIIEYLIAITVIPAIVLTVVHVTELKDVRNVQYELLSEEEGVFNITPGTFEKLRENKRIKNYELESNYPLITLEEMDRATWELGDLKNEIYINENGEKRIIVNVERIVFDGSEYWYYHPADQESKPDVLTFFLTNIPNISLYPDYSNLESNYFPFNYEVWNKNEVGISSHPIYNNIYINISKSELKNYSDEISDEGKRILFKQWLQDKYNEGNPLTVFYELADQQDRPVEVYDFSKFRLVFSKNRIRVIFDVDDGYYLWEITPDDRMIPINGQYDLGNIWTVKFYVYEIQQPLIRSLVLLIPIIVISGLLFYMFNVLKKKDLSY